MDTAFELRRYADEDVSEVARGLQISFDLSDVPTLRHWAKLMHEGADEIERLQDALLRIGKGEKVYCQDGHEEAVLIARAALKKER